MATTPRPLRIPEDDWNAAVAAFPAERGRRSGLTAEVAGFIAFLAEDPQRWRAVKAEAERRGVTPWHLVADAVERLVAR